MCRPRVSARRCLRLSSRFDSDLLVLYSCCRSQQYLLSTRLSPPLLGNQGSGVKLYSMSVSWSSSELFVVLSVEVADIYILDSLSSLYYKCKARLNSVMKLLCTKHSVTVL